MQAKKCFVLEPEEEKDHHVIDLYHRYLRKFLTPKKFAVK